MVSELHFADSDNVTISEKLWFNFEYTVRDAFNKIFESAGSYTL